ncbi:MAG: glycosyltransferase family 4 protein [Verrucomicrobia bacterium]|nr:glycosyltransferase family 4 protein [Verrucomicrobiota bacterium]
MNRPRPKPMTNFVLPKLCFVAGTLEHGGAERQLFYTLRALCEAGVAPRLLTLDQGQFWEARIQALGVPIRRVGQRGSRLARLWQVVREVRRDPPAALQSQHFYANAYVGMAARLFRISGIGAMRNDGHTEVAGCGSVGGRLNLHLPTTLAANSQRALQYAAARGVPAGRLYFLPNVVDTDWFEPPVGESAPVPFTLVTVGRLVRQKRLDRFLAILARLRTEAGLEVRGLIAGPGCQDEDLRPELESQARRLGLLPGFVEFRGGVSDIRAVYQQAAVCILTSDFEGTPNVLLEAMASGLPVVATRVGGVPEIVQDGETGLLVEPDDLDKQVAAVAALVRNPERRARLGSRGRAYVEAHHSLKRLPVYLTGLYQQALHPRRRPVNAGIRRASI